MRSMSEHSLLDDTDTARLLAKKSSYQAWKCVSFGCSLLALLLLLSKWQEISSDLQLLLNIEHLLLSTHQQPQSTGSNKSSLFDQLNLDRANPSASVDGQMPASASPELMFDSSNNNETDHASLNQSSQQLVMMSHMHNSASRELQANQLLKQEVGTFIAEFRGAKSTISLSSLLVSVYIISWILMTLAINDARISNDISLRNILLLSVFGAIDMAASVGFVLVRLIMYSVKNNSFRGEMLASTGFRDTPVRLAPDQLTAFTALRLVAMRSCSAYMDVYVSFIVVLLTVLRLYAILKALAYYKHLRRCSSSANCLGNQELPSRPNTANQWPPADNQLSPGQGSAKQVWSVLQAHQQPYGSYSSVSGQQAMISGQLSPPHQPIISQHPSGYGAAQLSQFVAMSDTIPRPTCRATIQRPAPPQRRELSEQILANKSKLVRLRNNPTSQQRPIAKLKSRSPSPVAQTRPQQTKPQSQRTQFRTSAPSTGEPVAPKKRHLFTLGPSDGTTYTLLSTDQLDRISRKLIESTSHRGTNRSATQAHLHRQVKNGKSADPMMKAKRNNNNNFELLLSANSNELADEHSAAYSSNELADQDDGFNNHPDDDDDNDSELSRAGEDSAGERQAARLVSISSLRHSTDGVAGYLAAESNNSNSNQRTSGECNEIHAELSSSAKNKLLLGEYFYA